MSFSFSSSCFRLMNHSQLDCLRKFDLVSSLSACCFMFFLIRFLASPWWHASQLLIGPPSWKTSIINDDDKVFVFCCCRRLPLISNWRQAMEPIKKFSDWREFREKLTRRCKLLWIFYGDIKSGILARGSFSTSWFYDKRLVDWELIPWVYFARWWFS